MSDDADERERAEAEALARALADQAGREPAPEDALETAALLRYGGRAGELSDERAEAVLEGLLSQVDAAPAAHSGTAKQASVLPWPKRRLASVLGLSVAVAAAALLVLVPLADRESAAPVSVRAPEVPQDLPRPTARLLAAQSSLAGKPELRDPAAFEAEMRAHRERVLRALERAYPAVVGQLERGGRR